MTQPNNPDDLYTDATEPWDDLKQHGSCDLKFLPPANLVEVPGDGDLDLNIWLEVPDLAPGLEELASMPRRYRRVDDDHGAVA